MDWGLFTGLLAELRGLGFDGWLAFHNYNEPLLNPRLGEELEAVASILPEARLAISPTEMCSPLPRWTGRLAPGSGMCG